MAKSGHAELLRELKVDLRALGPGNCSPGYLGYIRGLVHAAYWIGVISSEMEQLALEYINKFEPPSAPWWNDD